MRLILILLFSSLVLAADLGDAKDLYADGDFLRASKLAASLDTSEGYSFAARALAEYSNTRPRNERDDYYQYSGNFSKGISEYTVLACFAPTKNKTRS